MISQAIPQPVVVLVHGTFAQGAKWTKSDSVLCRQLEAKLHPMFVIFNWSGNNTNRARIRAGRELSTLLRVLLTQHPNCPISVVGHSHAGNIALYAVRDVDSPQVAVITVGTPFICCSPRNFNLHLHTLELGIHFLVGFVLAAIALLGIGFVFEKWILIPNLSETLELNRLPSLLTGLPLIIMGAIGGYWYFHTAKNMSFGIGAGLVNKKFKALGVQLQRQQKRVELTLAARSPPKVNLLCLYTARDEALTGLRLVDLLGETGAFINSLWLKIVLIAITAFFAILLAIPLYYVAVIRTPMLIRRLEQWFPWMHNWPFNEWQAVTLTLGMLGLLPILFLLSPLSLIIMASIRRLGYWDDMAMIYLHTKLWTSPYPMTDGTLTPGARCYRKCADTSKHSRLRLLLSLRHSLLLESVESVDYITSWINNWSHQNAWLQSTRPDSP